MSYEGLFVSLVIAAVVVWLIASPLLRRDKRRTGIDAQARERLLTYYERVLTNIRDLDEDHATGKLLDADHATEREAWVQRGIQVLRALDELDAGTITVDLDEAAVDEATDAALEAAIRAYKNQSHAAN